MGDFSFFFFFFFEDKETEVWQRLSKNVGLVYSKKYFL